MVHYKKYEVTFTKVMHDTLYLQAENIQEAIEMANQFSTTLTNITKVSQGSDDACSLTPERLVTILGERNSQKEHTS
jgi:hypothetical protein|tara:strand:+ start:80 stop:310 length:231 start_codon:yes stop_codon:yes gene_type:complete